MKYKTHTVTAPPRIDHDLPGDTHHIFVLKFAIGTIELPHSFGFDRIFSFKKVNPGEGAITIAAAAGQSIDGVPSFSLSSLFQTVQLISGENGWHILSSLGGN